MNKKEIIKVRQWAEPDLKSRKLKKQFLNNYLEEIKTIKKIDSATSEKKKKLLRNKLDTIRKKQKTNTQRIQQANRKRINATNKIIRKNRMKKIK